MAINIDNDITVRRSIQQYLFPFLLQEKKIESFIDKLTDEGFSFFDLDDTELENQFYGKDRVSHRSMDHFFMPNIEPILFPKSKDERQGIRRFSKKLNYHCKLEAPSLETSFIIESADVYICPFHIGFVNLRVSLPKELSYDDVLYFADTFRVLENISENEEKMKIHCQEHVFDEVKDLIYETLVPPMEEYAENNSEQEEFYFGTLPFFVDERMYVISYIHYDGGALSEADLYRAGKLNGYDIDGKRFIGANNPDYIAEYCKNKVYKRWADRTYYVMSEHHFSCITREDGKREKELASQLYGQQFYSIFLLLYYKITLLKFSHDHGKIDVEKDQEETELLILKITAFSSKFYLPSISSTESGTDIYEYMKKNFKVDELYKNVRNTLNTLYQNQEKLADKRLNYMLQFVSTYVVIGGLFGMNLVIEDWKEGFKLSTLAGYTFFEWFSFVVIISGIIVALAQGAFFLHSYIRERKSKKKRIF